MITSKAKVFGPYNLMELNELPEGQTLLTVPYSEVQGAQLLCSVTNGSAGTPFGIDTQFFLEFEVGIWGSYQGFLNLLKRTGMRALTGPMTYMFPIDFPFESISIKARNMSGGRRGPGTDGVVTEANGFKSALTVHVQARAGIGFAPSR